MKPQGKPPVVPAVSSLPMLVRSLFAAVIVFAALPLFAADSDPAYARWVKSWAERPVTSPALGGAGLKLVVSCVRGEAADATVTAMTPVDRLKLSYHIKVSSTEVATNGSFRTFTLSNTDAQTSAVRQLSVEDLKILDPLLGQLPDDHAQLPPAGQRVVVQFLTAGQWHVRVYDGNKLPPEVTDVVNLLAKPYDKLF
ncbi:MAG TPA: hypothetical protein VF492_09360 [Verrucomicrobiae bacterium]